MFFENFQRGAHAALDRLRLVQARDHDRHVDRSLGGGTARDGGGGEVLGAARHHRKEYVLLSSPTEVLAEPLQRSDDARLRGLRLPLSLHGGRRRALVPQPGRAARRAGAHRHVPDAAAVAARGAAIDARRRGEGGRPEDAAVRERAAADPPAAPLRARRLRAPAPPRAAVRRRPHVLVPVLLPAGSSRGPAARRVPGVRGLVRGLDARLLGRVPRPGGPTGLASPAAVHPRQAARLLLLGAARAAAGRGGLPG